MLGPEQILCQWVSFFLILNIVTFKYFGRMRSMLLVITLFYAFFLQLWKFFWILFKSKTDRIRWFLPHSTRDFLTLLGYIDYLELFPPKLLGRCHTQVRCVNT